MFKKYALPIGISLLYLITHLTSLTLLPVFADESIYIRWSQLLMDNWREYLFFALNDGKTPLFIWLLVPFQYLFSDQLFAARFVSVMMGFFQLFMMKEIVKTLGGRQKAQGLSMFLTAILPFFYLYHRFALMDGLLTLFLSGTILGCIKLVQLKKVTLKTASTWTLLTGISFGLALWSKLPALFILPALPFFIFLTAPLKKETVLKQLVALGSAGFLGLLIFATLRISPAFGQLFSRSSDFTYPVSEVLLNGKWQQTLPNIPNYIWYFIKYLTWPVLVLSFAGLFSRKNRRVSFVMMTVFLAMSSVFFVFGKVVYSRYFLPVALPFTILASLNAQALYDRFLTRQKDMPKKLAAIALTTILFGTVVSESFQFILPAVMAPTTIPFLNSDREQYLTTWSAGIGIPETVKYITEESKNHTIAVATEGRFGTLPDGLLLYFHNRDLNKIYIEGTEQYPVTSLPAKFTDRAKYFDQSILVVNSDRMGIELPPEALLHSYCRPDKASCLQIWDITSQVKNSQSVTP